MFKLNNEENLRFYPVGKEELCSMLNDSFQHISGILGPFSDEEVVVSLKESGGGGSVPGFFSISPLILSDQSAKESLFSFILHEMTHALTYQWGESFLPLFSEGGAYLIGGIYLESKYSNDFNAFVKAYLETERLHLVDLLDPQRFFSDKESYGCTSRYSASFVGYLLDNFGVESIKATFKYGGEIDYEKSRYHKAKKHRIDCLKRWLSDIGKKTIQDLETEYLEFIHNTVKINHNPAFIERKNKDCQRRAYPFWRCYKCWRPNKETTNRCSYCSAKRQERNEFDRM